MLTRKERRQRDKETKVGEGSREKKKEGYLVRHFSDIHKLRDSGRIR